MRAFRSLLVAGLSLVASQAMAANILTNPGFESGFSPWINSTDFCSGCTWAVTGTDAHSGAFSAFIEGNRLLEQTFSGIATSDISEASMWLKMPGAGFAAISFRYSDSVDATHVVNVGSSWTQFNLTSLLDASKTLTGIGIYGCGGCNSPSQTFVDDFVVNQISAVPEPGAYGLALAGLTVLGLITRRRREA